MQDGDAEIADQMEEEVDDEEHRLGDEIEPAPVDQQIEMVEVELAVVAFEARQRKIDADRLTSLAPANSRALALPVRARLDGLRLHQIVGLIGLLRAELAGGEPRVNLGVGVGEKRRRPVFVGDAEPGIGDVERLVLLVFDLLVGLFLQALVAHHADQALMQNVIALHLRRAVARDQRVGQQRHRGAALVCHIVLDGEEIMVVDRDAAAEDEAFAVVEAQRYRMIDAERPLPSCFHTVSAPGIFAVVPDAATQPNSA